MSGMKIGTALFCGLFAGFTLASTEAQDLNFAVQEYLGEVTGLQGQQIRFKTDEDEELIAQVESGNRQSVFGPAASTIFRISGTDNGTFLRTGMFVRFSAHLSKTRKPKSDITHLEVFMPDSFSTMGMIEQELNDDPVAPTDGKDGDDRKAKATAKLYFIGGQIKGVTKNKLTVQVPNEKSSRTIQFPFDPEKVKVDFNLTDPRVIKVGDRIRVLGAEIRKPLIAAGEVTITRTSKLGEFTGDDAATKKLNEVEGKVVDNRLLVIGDGEPEMMPEAGDKAAATTDLTDVGDNKPEGNAITDRFDSLRQIDKTVEGNANKDQEDSISQAASKTEPSPPKKKRFHRIN